MFKKIAIATTFVAMLAFTSLGTNSQVEAGCGYRGGGHHGGGYGVYYGGGYGPRRRSVSYYGGYGGYGGCGRSYNSYYAPHRHGGVSFSIGF